MCSLTGRWIHCEQDALVNTVFGRVADLLRVDKQMIWDGQPECCWGNKHGSCGNKEEADNIYEEDHNDKLLPMHDQVIMVMQLLQYRNGKQYVSHHDFTSLQS